MFTGIITAVGTIREVHNQGDLHAIIACPFDPAEIAIGASIACSGVCLTVVDRGGELGDAWFAVDISGETVSRTPQDLWRPERKLNLEQALRLGDELGGHIVTGHVDDIGRLISRQVVGASVIMTIACTRDIAPFIAPKGSVTVDGVSLTVNDVTDAADGSAQFTLNIIPHTAEVTTLGELQPGDPVNLEIDVLARYLKRMQSLRD